MRNRMLAASLVACVTMMAASVVYAQLKKGAYRPADLGSMRQAAPMESAPDSVYQVPAYPAPAVELAPGDGQREVQIYCNTCHTARYITMQPPLPAPTWEAEVNKMNKTFGAGLPDDITQKITAYLQAHYTPENRKE
jgi:mono/diheme cytochrome c family protein